MNRLKQAFRRPIFIVTAILMLFCLMHFWSRWTTVPPVGRAAPAPVGFLEQIESLTYDARVKFAWTQARTKEDIATNMATILYDDVALEAVNDGTLAPYYAPAKDLASLRKLYRRLWPWPRFIHGQVVRELTAQGARAIGFDILFVDPSEEREEEYIEDIETAVQNHRTEEIARPERVIVADVHGTVMYSSKAAAGWKSLKVGMTLGTNSLIRTGPESTADVLLANGPRVRVTENTTIGVSPLVTGDSTWGQDWLSRRNEDRIEGVITKMDKDATNSSAQTVRAKLSDTAKNPSVKGLSSDQFFARQIEKAGNVYLAVESEETYPVQLFLGNKARMASIASHFDNAVLRRVRPFQEMRIWHPLLRELSTTLDLDLSRATIEQDKVIIPHRLRATLEPPVPWVQVPLNADGSMKLTHEGDIDFAEDPDDEGLHTEFPIEIRRIWIMGIALAAKALGLDLDNPEIHHDKIVLRGPGATRVIPLDSDGYFYINWSVSSQDLVQHKAPIYSGQLREVLINDKFRSSGQKAWAESAPFKGRIVLIGVTASGSKLTDLGATPLDAQTPLLMRHLNVANSILTGRFVQRSSVSLELLLILLMGSAAAAIALNTRPVWASGTVLLLSATYATCAVALFINQRVWIPMVLPLVCPLVVGHTCILIERADPMSVARRFFAQAGFRKVEAISPTLLHLRPKEDQMGAVALLWRDKSTTVPQMLIDTLRSAQRQEEKLKIYLIYDRHMPSSRSIQKWRGELGCEIIPLFGAMLEKGLAEQNYEGQLRQLEEPYLIRVDPYAEFKPIADPTWFYGRTDLIDRLPACLAQGQHLGIFGLRKVGKTSLTNQLRQRFVATPSVFLDCQAVPAKAESLFNAIYSELHASLRVLKIARLPPGKTIEDAERFAESIVALRECWERMGQRDPFILVLDEIDKLFPPPDMQNREEILAEYVKVFRVLRGLAQTRQCLVTCVIAYRPAISRQNLLSVRVGENPMFNSFQEVYLGFLTERDSEAMIREIGLWKNIIWEQEAARKVFQYCGGHPLITRYFASHACKKGMLKQVDLERVLETSTEIERTLRKNEIGNYYKEAVTDLLFSEELQVLNLIAQTDGPVPESALPTALTGALTNLENFGLVENQNGQLRLTADLFRTWLRRRLSG